MKFSESSLSLLRKESGEVRKLLAKFEGENVASRLWNKDASLWKRDSAIRRKIVDRLGWLDVPEKMKSRIPELIEFRNDIIQAGYKNIVLLGMGGSSLCPEVCRKIFGISSGSPGFYVLDTTSPATILRTEKKLRSEKTLYILASKSGSTLEVDSLYRYFLEKVEMLHPGGAGEYFMAITDPGTSLERLARDKMFRKVFTNPPDIGGRYSALSYFGLVPALLMGIDLKLFLGKALEMSGKCRSEISAERNPGVLLGAVLATFGRAGRNKITFVLPPPLLSFGIWLEQLIAESTGKEGKGLVPVEGETIGKPESYGTDRLFIFYTIRSDQNAPLERQIERLVDAGQPVVVIEIEETYDLAGEFFRWEMATAITGIPWEINPFDEPNVTESKENTAKILEIYKNSGSLPVSVPLLTEQGVTLFGESKSGEAASLVQNLIRFFSEIPETHYLVLMAYLDSSDENEMLLQELRLLIRDHFRIATTVGYGPRFLHSTGQLHKGGPKEGAYVQITTEPSEDIAVPGKGYTFNTLNRSQALGDLDSLKKRGLPVLQLHLTRSPGEGLKYVMDILEKAFRQ
ncbi:MAG: glucose-6-phosphate isomerase [Nitrospirae bacterium]|nr:glucose-6-phosphate isomerase [Nitrospirota bacterium]